MNSAKEADEQREEIASSMRWELLMLESFGRWFTRASGVVTDDSMLDEVKHSYRHSYLQVSQSRADNSNHWLHEIQHTLEKLRRDFDDFTRLAGKED